MVLPTQVAPAASSCSTHTAETAAGGCVSSQVGLPQAVRRPAISIRSFAATVKSDSCPSPVGVNVNCSMKAPLCSKVMDDIAKECWTRQSANASLQWAANDENRAQSFVAQFYSQILKRDVNAREPAWT